MDVNDLNEHKAGMFDAIRDFFVQLTEIARLGQQKVQADLDEASQERKPE